MDRFQPILQSHGLEVTTIPVEERMDEKDLLVYAGQYEATICGDDRYSVTVLDAAVPPLQVISKWGTGIDSIDYEYARSLGVQVLRTTNAFTMPVADSVLGYILAFARQQPWLDKAMKSGIWKKIKGRSLSECTLGVIGVGNCGKAVIRRAGVFGMKILGNDIIKVAPDFLIENHVEMLPLEELCSRSDFISVNCDLNPTSHHLINAQSLGWMKESAVLINTARGAVVDEQALTTALQKGEIAGAALDVFELEPLPTSSSLRMMDNVMLAPHNANSSPAAWERIHWNTIRNMLVGLGIEPAF
jgi:D-3-phosphoglycerate dehydrogenase